MEPSPVATNAKVLIAEYRALCVEAARHSSEGWSPSPVEAWKDDVVVTPAALDAFRSSPVSAGTQNWPDRTPNDARGADGLYPARAPAETVAATKAIVLGLQEFGARLPAPLHPEFLRLALDDKSFGGRPVPVDGLGPVSESSTRFAYYAALLGEFVKDGETVLEIGAGFGGTCSRLLQRRPGVRYVITDLPLNLLLAAR